MYINDLHILYYLGLGLIGMIIGQFIDWCNIRMPEHKKIISKNFFTIYLKNFKPNYLLMFTNAIFYIAILYFYGISDIRTYEYLFLIPILISVFQIDYKKQIIPTRLSLTLLEVGLIFTFIEGISNLNIAIDKIMGFAIGGIIFLIIAFLSKLFSSKDTVEYGDVKLASFLGLFFGYKATIVIAIISFIIAGITSLILLLIKNKKINEYIAFGPFIAIASAIIMLIPIEELMVLLINL